MAVVTADLIAEYVSAACLRSVLRQTPHSATE